MLTSASRRGEFHSLQITRIVPVHCNGNKIILTKLHVPMLQNQSLSLEQLSFNKAYATILTGEVYRTIRSPKAITQYWKFLNNEYENKYITFLQNNTNREHLQCFGHNKCLYYQSTICHSTIFHTIAVHKWYWFCFTDRTPSSSTGNSKEGKHLFGNNMEEHLLQKQTQQLTTDQEI